KKVFFALHIMASGKDLWLSLGRKVLGIALDLRYVFYVLMHPTLLCLIFMIINSLHAMEFHSYIISFLNF
ncbi:hypothetical protein ACJX0J_020212, partial [Zea mays]